MPRWSASRDLSWIKPSTTLFKLCSSFIKILLSSQVFVLVLRWQVACSRAGLAWLHFYRWHLTTMKYDHICFHFIPCRYGHCTYVNQLFLYIYLEGFFFQVCHITPLTTKELFSTQVYERKQQREIGEHNTIQFAIHGT